MGQTSSSSYITHRSHLNGLSNQLKSVTSALHVRRQSRILCRQNSPCRRVGLRHISLNYRCTGVAADLHYCQWSNVWRRRCHLVCGLAVEERPVALFAWHRDVASQAVSQALSILGQVNKSRENEDARVTITVVINRFTKPF
jgi:hypothetical protein